MKLRVHEPMAFLKWAMRRRQFADISIRILAVILARRGTSISEIARRLEFERLTVRKWLNRYREQGIEGLEDRKSTGHPPKLNSGQKQEIARILDRGPEPSEALARYRLEDIQRIIQRKWGIRISRSATWNLLTELGFSHRKARPRHHKQSARAIAGWKRRAFFSSEGSKSSIPTGQSKSGSRMRVGLARKVRSTTNGREQGVIVESRSKTASSVPISSEL
jgi:transposase